MLTTLGLARLEHCIGDTSVGSTSFIFAFFTKWQDESTKSKHNCPWYMQHYQHQGMLMARQLRWSGHVDIVARMEDYHSYPICCFTASCPLERTRPQDAPVVQYKHCLKSHLSAIACMLDPHTFEEASSEQLKWRQLCDNAPWKLRSVSRISLKRQLQKSNVTQINTCQA